jgi:predicted AAA+ superfamily ATPase
VNQLESLRLIQNRLTRDLPAWERPIVARLEESLSAGARAILLTGPRGVGKTTYLLKKARDSDWVYFSADHPHVASQSLFELVESAYMSGARGVVVDEVHYARNWSQHLKAIYDAFPDLSIWASDSSTLILRQGMADLSRRFLVRRMPLLSLREYLFLSTQEDDDSGRQELLGTPTLDPFDLENPRERKIIGRLLKGGKVLRGYQSWIRCGFRPIFLEGVDSYPERLLAVVEKTLSMDIPFLVPQLNEGNLRFMSAVIGYLAQASVPMLAVNSLCREWEIGKEKLYQLLSAMEQAQILRIVRKQKDRSLHSVGAKIFLQDPSLYSALDGDRGTAREALVVACLQEAGYEVYANSDERQADFKVVSRVPGAGQSRKEWLIEVGGASKKPKAADFVIRDGIDEASGRQIPMWCLGFAY